MVFLRNLVFLSDKLSFSEKPSFSPEKLSFSEKPGFSGRKTRFFWQKNSVFLAEKLGFSEKNRVYLILVTFACHTSDEYTGGGVKITRGLEMVRCDNSKGAIGGHGGMKH